MGGVWKLPTCKWLLLGQVLFQTSLTRETNKDALLWIPCDVLPCGVLTWEPGVRCGIRAPGVLQRSGPDMQQPQSEGGKVQSSHLRAGKLLIMVTSEQLDL